MSRPMIRFLLPSLSIERRPARHSAGRRTRFRPRLDSLERRDLLATFTVTTAANAGPGSLRQAVLDSNALPGADVVRFANNLRGGTITLASPINITDHLAIRGPGARALTISGGGTTNLLTVVPPEADFLRDVPPTELTIEGLSLANALQATFEGPAYGSGGALFTYRADVTLIDTTWRNNRATSGGAVAVMPGQVIDDQGNYVKDIPVSLTVRDSQFVSNVAEGFTASGGAIYAYGTLDVTRTSFESNRASGLYLSYGGAIYNSSADPSTIVGSSFVGNRAEGTGSFPSLLTMSFGGAVHVDYGSGLAVADSRFDGNRAAGQSTAAGGAINASLSEPGQITITGSSFVGNEAATLPIPPGGSLFGPAGAWGGAVNGGPLLVKHSTFRGNRAVGADNPIHDGAVGLGGAIAGIGNSLDLEDVLFQDNAARGGRGGIGAQGGGYARGGAVYNLGGTTTIEDALFLSNSTVGGDATRPGSEGGYADGGGLSLSGGSGQVLTNVSFIGNSVRGGKGSPADLDTGTPAGRGGDGFGGGLFVGDTLTTLAGGLFVTNEARGGNSPAGEAGDGAGGGIYSAGDLTIHATLLSANRARGGAGASGGDALGGGLFASGILRAMELVVLANVADAGPAGQGLGGGIYLEPGTVAVLKKTKALGNKATTAGHQIYGSYTS